MNFRNIIYLFFLPLLFISKNTCSQVKINEYSGSNVGAVTDAFGVVQDWIELYNPGTTVINIQGFYLSNDLGNISRWQFPLNTTIAAKGFLKVFASGANVTATNGGVKEYHTNYKLLQTKPEKIILANAMGVIVDSLTITPNLKNHSWGRNPDGAATWKLYTTHTFNTSNTGNALTSYLIRPVFSAGSGTYSGGISLSISSTQSNTKIKYTLDGTDPNTSASAITASSPVSLNLSTTKVVRAVCTDVSTTPTYFNSFIETHTYFFSPDNAFTLPVVSLCADTAQLIINPLSVVDAYIEYFETDRSLAMTSFGYANLHQNNGMGFPQVAFNFTAVDEYGYNYTNRHQFFDNPTLGASSRTDHEKIIFSNASADNFPSGGGKNGGNKRPTHLRDAFCQTYALRKNLNLEGRRYEPVIMFVNGGYYGIYELRENMDKENTTHYYTQKDPMILEYSGTAYLNNPPQAWQTDWNNAYNYVMNNPMTVAANYTQASKLIDIDNLIDYVIYNTYVVNSNFIKSNGAWWRGSDGAKPKSKWRYWMKDMDDTFGAGEDLIGLGNTGPLSDPCAYNNALPAGNPATGHFALFNKLLTNNDFKTLFLNRYADLVNTSLSCDSLIEHFNYFKALLSPEMPRHAKKWANTLTAPNDSLKDWNRNMDSLQSWIKKRCKVVDSLVVSCYKVKGPYSFCLEIDPPLAGTIKLNTVTISTFPFYGMYFGDVNMSATANPNQNYLFDHWEPTNFTIPDPDIKNSTLKWEFDTVSCLKAVFKLKAPFLTEGEAIVPGAFTPNGDGNNDILNIYGTNRATHFELEIFNRWGQMVFQSRDKTKGWDGKFNGAEAPAGVYAYRFNVTIDGTDYIKSGSFTLIR